jgi:hypothetical protein
MKSPDLEDLKQALDRYFVAVQAQKSASPPDLLPIFRELDALESRLAPLLSPRLKHFLENKSYRKAHDFLSGVPAAQLGH